MIAVLNVHGAHVANTELRNHGASLCIAKALGFRRGLSFYLGWMQGPSVSRGYLVSLG